MKIDRQIGILTILLQNEKVTALELAKRFEVSRRTILRDVDSLCLAGIPVVTTQGGNGGISILEGYKINKNVLTSDELKTLIAGLKSIDSVSKTSNFESLMMKLSPSNVVVSLADSIVIDLSSHYKDSLSDKIELIKQAVAERRTILFDYYYGKGETPREIEPYFAEFRWNDWYVFGWCKKRNDFRRFKLNRLWNCRLSEEVFTLRPVPSEKGNAGDFFQRTESHNIKILFDKSVRFRLIEEYGLNCYEETKDGLLFSTDYVNKDYIFNWILGFGDKARIIEPQNTVSEFSEIVKNILKLYN